MKQITNFVLEGESLTLIIEFEDEKTDIRYQ